MHNIYRYFGHQMTSFSTHAPIQNQSNPNAMSESIDHLLMCIDKHSTL